MTRFMQNKLRKFTEGCQATAGITHRTDHVEANLFAEQRTIDSEKRGTRARHRRQRANDLSELSSGVQAPTQQA